MSDAPNITVTRSGSGHSYAVDGRRVPGVTTILDNGFPKPGLIQWSADATARYALQHLDDVDRSDPFKVYDKWRKARFGESDEAKVRGTEIHELAARIVAGEHVEVLPHVHGFVDSAIRFLDVEGVNPVRTEQVVASARHGYGGRFDMLADTNRGRALLDWKTGNSPPYHEAALQLAAYRYAEWWLEADGTTTGVDDPCDWCGVVWLRPERFEVFPIVATRETFRSFLYVAEVAKLTQSHRSTLVGDPL
jgi:hypothetical protein